MNTLFHKPKSLFNYLIKPIKTLIEFFSPLSYDWKFALVFFLGLLLIVPMVILYLIDFKHSAFKQTFFNPDVAFDLKWLLTIWISLIGIFVSIRIYFEIQNKAHNIQEFMRIVYTIINKAKVNEHVYIVLPTAFIGYLNYLKGKNHAYSKFEKKLKSLNNLKIAFLKTDIASLTSINENSIESDETIGSLASFPSSITDDNLLMKFHENEFGDGKNKKYRHEYFAHLIIFLKELKDSQVSKSNTIDFISQTDINVKFDVLVANVDQADCFIGDVDVLSQIDIKYSGERIISENLAKNIEMIYSSYITTS